MKLSEEIRKLLNAWQIWRSGKRHQVLLELLDKAEQLETINKKLLNALKDCVVILQCKTGGLEQEEQFVIERAQVAIRKAEEQIR